MDKDIQDEAIREDANEEDVGLCNRCKRGVCAKKEKDIPSVKRRKRREEGVYLGTAEEEIYPAVKVTSNSASVLCRKERWKEVNGARLQVSK